nr:beta-carotene isomerase D27, chloroplastic isoform X2 [Ipomoea batatas]
MALALVRPPHLASPPHPRRPNTNTNTSLRHPTLGVFCSSKPLPTDAGARSEYKPAPLDNLFLHLFRSKMVQESGWDSDKPGYDGLIEVANRLVIGRSNSETREAAVRILQSLFPPWLLDLYKMLIAPLAGGRLFWLVLSCWMCFFVRIASFEVQFMVVRLSLLLQLAIVSPLCISSLL